MSLSPTSLGGLCAPANTPLNAYELVLEEGGSAAAPAPARKIVARMRRPDTVRSAGAAASAAPVRNLTCVGFVEGPDPLALGTAHAPGSVRPVSLLIVAE